jgi:FtsP/CotA-like multicopper oxidase with cupredoxin domain
LALPSLDGRSPHRKNNPLPQGTETADMVPDAPGLWLFHCQVYDHLDAGMMARYEVLPALAAGDKTGRVSAGF